nr:hypothetical protein [Tanacetum cinerariifolium]
MPSLEDPEQAPLSPDYVPGPKEPKQAPLSPDYVPGLKELEQAPLSPDYVPGPEEPEQAPPLPVYLPYVPELVFPEYMPPEDEVFPAEEQPLPEDLEEDPVDYLADSTVVALPVVDHVPSEEVTKPLPQIPSPPLPISSPPPNSPTHIEIPKSCLPLRKRLRFASPTPSQEVGESSTAGAARQDEPVVERNNPYSLVREDLYEFFDRVDVTHGRPMSKELDYGITDTRDELVGASEEIAPTTLQGVNQRVTNLSIVVKLENTIMDMPVHHPLAIMIEREARMARKAWGLSMDVSENEHSNVMSLRTMLVTQMIKFKKHNGPTKGPAQPDAPGEKMAPKRTTRSTLIITTPTSGTTTSVTNAQLQAMIDQGVTALLVARDANRNGDDIHTSGTGRPVHVAREYTYPDFLKCQPLNFKGTKGVVGLSQWFEKMESVYSISNCTVACQVKFATCTLQGNSLTWWNSHVKTTTPEAAHAMPWRTLKKMMTDKYCPMGEIKKLESEM